MSAFAFKDVPAGVRNNNPGNIRKNPDFKWDGEIGQDKRGFVQFSNPVYGFRAMAKLLRNYYDKQGLRTIRDIIYRYAPPSENDSRGYTNFVAVALKINPTEKILKDDFERLLPLLIHRMAQMEVGRGHYGLALAKQGYKLA